MATPATVKGTAGLSFGVCSVVGVIMENLDAEIPGQVTEAADEQDNVVGFAIHHSNRADINGGYLFLGTDVTAIGSTIALTTYVPFSGAGVYVYAYGRRYTNKSFVKGTFKAICVSGIA